MWVPKMPSERSRPEFHQIDEFNFDSAFVNSVFGNILTEPASSYPLIPVMQATDLGD